jgi:hypothetical protein
MAARPLEYHLGPSRRSLERGPRRIARWRQGTVGGDRIDQIDRVERATRVVRRAVRSSVTDEAHSPSHMRSNDMVGQLMQLGFCYKPATGPIGRAAAWKGMDGRCLRTDW